MQQMNSAHTNRLLDIAEALKVTVEDFFNPENEAAKLSVQARAFKLLSSYVTGDDINLSDRDLLNIIADRILEDK